MFPARGEFALGERWGVGVTTSKDGSFHSGQYRAGRAQGKGQEEAKGTEMLYEGEYANGLRHGQGCASTPVEETRRRWLAG